MKVYVVIKVIDAYPECGGGKYPDAIFLNYANADKYAVKKNIETNACNKTNVFYKIETWETADEKEN